MTAYRQIAQDALIQLINALKFKEGYETDEFNDLTVRQVYGIIENLSGVIDYLDTLGPRPVNLPINLKVDGMSLHEIDAKVGGIDSTLILPGAAGSRGLHRNVLDNLLDMRLWGEVRNKTLYVTSLESDHIPDQEKTVLYKIFSKNGSIPARHLTIKNHKNKCEFSWVGCWYMSIDLD